MKKIVALLLLVGLWGCMDMTSENTNYNGVQPEKGTPEFAAIDLDGDGVISADEWASWQWKQQ